MFRDPTRGAAALTLPLGRGARLLALGLLAVSVGCTADTAGPTPNPGGADASLGDDAGVGPSDGGGGPTDGGLPPTDGGVVEPELKRSAKARVKFKGRDRLRADLAQALGFAPGELCAELGRFDCFDVHRISLGGVEPYDSNIFKPLEQTPITAPLAVERVALSACARRVDQDGGGANGVIFKDVPLDGAALGEPDGPAIRAAFDTLYRRALTRPMRDAEWTHLRGLYDTVVASGDAQPARSFAILGCFSVITSMEALFY